MAMQSSEFRMNTPSITTLELQKMSMPSKFPPQLMDLMLSRVTFCDCPTKTVLPLGTTTIPLTTTLVEFTILTPPRGDSYNMPRPRMWTSYTLLQSNWPRTPAPPAIYTVLPVGTFNTFPST